MAIFRNLRHLTGALVGATGAQLHLLLGGADPVCRFEPTCSRYAVEAIEKRGVLVGSFLIFQRLLRCLPGGKSGIDPVPVQKDLHGA